jgi:hypothetical protein
VAAPVLVGAAIGFSALSVVDAVREPRPDDPFVAALYRLAAEATPAARAVEGPVLVRSEADIALVFGGQDVGVDTLVLALDRAGVDAVVEAEQDFRFGSERARPETAVAELRLVTSGRPVPDGFRVVATVDPLTPQQRAVRTGVLAEVRALLPDPTVDVFEAAAADPSLRAILDRAAGIPDLPVLVLLIGEPA